MRKLIGVDIGGTFTDLVFLDLQTGIIKIEKVATTPEDPSLGFILGLKTLGVSCTELELIIHGTTVATNAILERKGGCCGLISTRGFRDILELRRRDRPHAYGLTGTYEPLVPRERRLEASERISAEGKVVIPLKRVEVETAGEQLVDAGVEAIVVSFLNSYMNSSHEQEAKKILKTRWPHLHVVGSAEVLPLFREFERTSTAVVNAYVQPVVSLYLSKLQERLQNTGYRKDILIMQSNGGMMSVEAAQDFSVKTILSGPAGGVIAATQIAAESGFKNLIAYDMGGTSLDVSLVVGGEPMVSNGTELSFGVPVMLSMVDIHTIGAGGGSIARVDQGGVLRVGPESAGAVPGPVCYGKGGTEPTVTDANLVLGRINPDYSIAGKKVGFAFDLKRARSAMTERIGEVLGLSLEEAAIAVLAVANNRIAGSIRRVSIDKGHDPRDFALFSFGGGGPLMVSFLLRELGIGQGIVPAYPGITSAWGCAIADLRQDFVTMVNRRLSQVDIGELEKILASHLEEGEAIMKRENVMLSQVQVIREADIAYEGQTHVIRTKLPFSPMSQDTISKSFRTAYLSRYGDVERGFGGLESQLEKMEIRLLNVRTLIIGVREEVVLKNLIFRPQTSMQEAFNGYRPVWVGDGTVDCPIYTRSRLPWGAKFSGPVVIEQADTTIWLEPGTRAFVDEGGSLLIEVE